MSNSSEQALSDELGGSLPERFRELSEERLAWLLETLKSAKVVQLADLDKSTEDTINGLPMMLRGPVRAIIGGKK
ncbi:MULTISPECIES: hypothetical protein [Antrihabitans]|uniref:Uncharacterized protein n=2 Tax=Antrihabitans TaxID=2799491 RepID=A0A934U3Z3_9NOCA|nr:hypothetical protein [Antrihabitans stalagmiti]MBJ8340065.1 hypothetical protein [Antrihabitans stalagmiti]